MTKTRKERAPVSRRGLAMLVPAVAVMIALLMSGCSSDGGDARLAQMTERHEQRQAEQNKQLAQLQQEVATGSRQLVEADAEARRELTVLQRELQAQQAQIVKGHDALEEERRQLASQRQRDPIIAAAIAGAMAIIASGGLWLALQARRVR